MTFDSNSFCPGGTGKKIKHCECRDIAGELEKIARAIKGNQRRAALDRINRTMATKAHRPCLLAMKAATQLAMGEMQAFEETVATFLQMAPTNLVALSHAAYLEVQKGDVEAGVERLQAALANVDEQMPGELYQSIGAVANGLMQKGKYIAARAHVLLQAVISRDENVVQALVEVSGVEGVPTLMKQEFTFDAAPDTAKWRKRLDAAAKLAQHGAWQAALEDFEAINQQYPGQLAVLKNIAVAHTFLGHQEAASGWHAFAASEGVSRQDAIHAEALAQLLDAGSGAMQTDILKLVFTIPDANQLFEQMSSKKSLLSQPVDTNRYAQMDVTPPKASFLLLNAPPVTETDELGIDDVREILGELAIYGKQTDREARLELIILKNAQYDKSMSLLSELFGDLVKDPTSTEVVQSTLNPNARWMPQIYPPPTAPRATARALRKEYLQRCLEERWTQLELSELGNLTADQAAQDPDARIKLEASILRMEQTAECESQHYDFNSLRARLGLEVSEDIHAADVDLKKVSLSDLHRVDPTSLDDEPLMEVFERTALFGLAHAFSRLGAEITHREGLDTRIDKASIYGRLAELAEAAEEDDRAIELIQKAQQAASDAGKSPATWLLQELALRITHNEPELASQVMERIKSRHMNEPGVGESLVSLLQQFGIMPATSHPASQQASAAVESPPADPSAIWTPEAGGSAEAEESKPSKLWLPDSD